MNKKFKFILTLSILFMFSNLIIATEKNKSRTVITTDGEVDDMNSVIRALYYSNDMDIEGIVLTSSMYHYAGNEKKGIKPFRWTGTDWIYDFLDKYEKIYPNLKVHDNSYPTPEYLKYITKIGNISNVGEMEEVTEGSKFLENLFLKKDSRKLYVQTWGGTNTTARALKSIEEKYSNNKNWSELKKEISERLVIYIILDQDDSYGNYIAKKWPEIKIINDRSNFWHFAYAWKFHSEEVNKYLQGQWLYENFKINHGPLLKKYALMGDGNLIDGELYEEQRGTEEYLEKNPQYQKYDFISEGDSPSFLYLIDNGLRSMENPSFGGWGGRFNVAKDNLYENVALDFNPYTNQFEAEYALMRWFDDIQRDFAARADWSVESDYNKANHNPIISVKEGLNIKAKAGEEVSLTAKGSDPDGDIITYKWWHYGEADSYEESKVSKNPIEYQKAYGLIFSIYRKLSENEKIDNIILNVSGNSNEKLKFKVPSDAKKGDTIHIILEGQDNGKFNLKHYQRVIITVK